MRSLSLSSTVLLAVSANAFAPGRIDTPVRLNLSLRSDASTADDSVMDAKRRIQPGRFDDMEKSLALPFMKRPPKLDGSHAGDVGFDPLGFSEEYDLYTMMEAELRHARLAMLAVVGWPLSELVAPEWMLRGEHHLAPSVLNGFSPLSFIATVVIFAGFGFFEYSTALRNKNKTPIGMKHQEDMANVWVYGMPGDYNFDPLGLYSSFGDDATGRKAMRELEIAHGRGAMLGITGFALWEKLIGHPVVENSMFFHPNFTLPLLGFLYAAFPFFYEIENNDKYLLQIKPTDDGKIRIARLQNWAGYRGEEAEKVIDKVTSLVKSATAEE